jgi:DNA-binding CsgD family transcriptional regulator
MMVDAAKRGVPETPDMETGRWLLAVLKEALRVDRVAVTGGVGRGIGAGAFLHHDLPVGYLDVYLREAMYRDDPFVLALKAADEVVDPAEVERATRTRPEASAMRLRRAFGFRAPLGVVVHAGGARVGAVALYRDRPFEPREIAFAAALAPRLHAAFDPGRRPAPVVTARERDCLHWCAMGKTAHEIGSILGISEHTAVAHLASVGRKLGTSNRTATVAEALRRGLIR